QLSDFEFRREFIRAVSPRQGVAQQNANYYVPVTDENIRGIDLCQRLMDTVELTFGDAVTLVTGPAGSGKTSELLRFGEQLATKHRSFIYADITDLLRSSEPLDAGRLLTGVVASLISAVNSQSSKRRVKLDTRPFLQRLKDAFGRLEISGFDTAASVNAGPVQFSTTLHSALRDSLDFRKKVQHVIENNRAQFRAEIHNIVKDLAKALTHDDGQPPVFVVDSIEHFRGIDDQDAPNSYLRVRESVEQIFSMYRDELTLPGLHVVYCVPSYVHCAWANTLAMLNIKVFTPTGDVFKPGLRQLRGIAEKRAPQDGGLLRLLGTNTRIDEIMHASGGLFRDLFRLLDHVISNASTLPASERAVWNALAECRRQFLGGPTGVSREQIMLLAQISTDTQYVPSREQQADFEFLETLGAILQYPNGPEGYWLGVHPMLKPVVDNVMASAKAPL
ncbi:MAG: ATP-binding protein, partial [Propionibacteriaceae bacterium]|nr:ATP-binding protein [Propionibacteriaceae bacterium]